MLPAVTVAAVLEIDLFCRLLRLNRQTGSGTAAQQLGGRKSKWWLHEGVTQHVCDKE